MLRFLKKNNTAEKPTESEQAPVAKPDAKQTLDEIVAAVYAHLKPLGFRKFGRTLHRFVSGDISQVVSFQVYRNMMEPSDKFCVNLGIRVPECAERKFQPSIEKTYYQEQECTLRSRLGSVSGRKEAWFSLCDDPTQTTEAMIEELDHFVLPVYDVLCSREAILSKRRDYPQMDTMGRHLIPLDECFIFGHLGDMDRARERFDAFYQEKQDELQNGRSIYLDQGMRYYSSRGTVYAAQSGYYTVFDDDVTRMQLKNLDALAVELGFREPPTE